VKPLTDDWKDEADSECESAESCPPGGAESSTQDSSKAKIETSKLSHSICVDGSEDTDSL
jgi:hypothetical protein